MPVVKPHTDQPGVYFITFTNYQWLQLIAQADAYDLVYKWFDYLQQSGHMITGYVIMPNHLHALIAFANTGKSINKIIANGKRFLAYGIVQRLKEKGEVELLEKLSNGVSEYEKKRGKLHEVFQRSFDMKECLSLRFINQKLKYMHDNPMSGKWSLVSDTVDYLHSSARYYETGEQGVYTVTNVIDIFDED